MYIKEHLIYVLFLVTFLSFSQEKFYTSINIPANLTKNANAVIRYSDIKIALESSSEMVITEKRIVTVLNKQGNNAVDAFVHYDDNVKIKELEVHVYSEFGAQINRIKKNDFKDVSAVDGGTLYSDSRVKYLEYTPIAYPYTIEFICETETKNTAFIPSFSPVSESFVSVENSEYSIVFPSTLDVRIKEKNIDSFQIEKEETAGQIVYKAKNIEAYKPEEYGPAFFNMAPKVLFATKQFTLEGVYAEVDDWETFGKWMYNDLISDTHDLPETTITAVTNLVKDETDPIEKAKKIYQYVQDKVRYISVQVGIGGWKPFNASEVDKLGYGDCKALTNYTMALLKAVNVPSNYSVVYAGSTQRCLDKDFASVQGNHVILSIPNNEDTVWLECTSQKLPFGFIGDFTDDRDVLVITPDGGKIQHTKKYATKENIQQTTGSCIVSTSGDIKVKVNVSSQGIQYDDKYWLETETERDLDTYYKKRWKYINSLSINKINISNDKNAITFIEEVDFEAPNYSKIVGNRMLLPLNVLNRNSHIPDRYRERKQPLIIKRGFEDRDEVEINLPSGYTIEAPPEDIVINNKFGSYEAKYTVKDAATIIYNRTFVVNDGEYLKEDYEPFRLFYKEVTKQDNAKVALIKN